MNNFQAICCHEFVPPLEQSHGYQFLSHGHQGSEKHTLCRTKQGEGLVGCGIMLKVVERAIPCLKARTATYFDDKLTRCMLKGSVVQVAVYLHMLLPSWYLSTTCFSRPESQTTPIDILLEVVFLLGIVIAYFRSV